MSRQKYSVSKYDSDLSDLGLRLRLRPRQRGLYLILGWGEFRVFRLGRESASLKLEDLLVDHEKNHFFVMDLILALLLDSEDLYRISS